MSKVIVHIGSHKTATTTIQDMFWENADLLEKNGVVYPRLGEFPVTGHHGLAKDWADLPETYALSAGSRETLKSITETYANKDVTVFLSSEEFSRGSPGRQTDFETLRSLLSGFDKVEIVLSLRNQWAFLQSIYLELSKSHNPLRPTNMVEPVIKEGLYQGLYVDYNLLLDRLLEAFDANQIRLFDFDTIKSSQGGVVGHFLRYLETELCVEALSTVNGGASNVSPMPLASWCANILYEPDTAPNWLIEEMELSLGTQYGGNLRSCLFTREEFMSLNAHFDACNETLRKRVKSVQPDFKISNSNLQENNLYRNDIHAGFWLLVCRNMVKRRR
ncbi:hypothetical protein [Shimia thalassica]|uniref:hypothetical protein n=1 Tax=Shimia thalassica TaxID=1715693 RepID=UPI0026E1BC6C|nr:hypothetical protein [Shimia thalassica]MDO6799752.1 hypothetical protein [Shimia thalassica]